MEGSAWERIQEEDNAEVLSRELSKTQPLQLQMAHQGLLACSFSTLHPQQSDPHPNFKILESGTI